MRQSSAVEQVYRVRSRGVKKIVECLSVDLVATISERGEESKERLVINPDKSLSVIFDPEGKIRPGALLNGPEPGLHGVMALFAGFQLIPELAHMLLEPPDLVLALGLP